MKILVITGSFLLGRKSTFKSILKKQLAQFKHAQHHWLELKIKALIGESLVVGSIEKKRELKKTANIQLRSFLQSETNSQSPDLTEVTLATLLQDEGLDFILSSFDEIFSTPEKFEKLLSETAVVFISSTFLKDLSELEPILHSVKRAHNKVVVGGALAGSLCHSFKGSPLLDILAIGYGEFLIPALAQWIKSDFIELNPPKTGRLVQKNHTVFLHSGAPETLSLDGLLTPDWKLAEEYYGKSFDMIYYESVRGCPYRCAFCNYPYLFDDKKFRTKSAKKMADDWEDYTKKLNVKYITCLDSLFTMPKQRLIEFCKILIERNIQVKWVCYARADDLNDESTVLLLKNAGCIQVQIGIESGDPGQLINMTKRTDVETNRAALLNCKKHGLTTLVSLIVGFPGETQTSIENTLKFMKETQPDFYFIAVFSVRVADVPILSPASRQKYNLITMNNDYSLSPYWSHQTMNSYEATQWTRYLSDQIISKKLSLDAFLFYQEILNYDFTLREDLLNLQHRAWKKHPLIRECFGIVFRFLDIFLKRDTEKFIKDTKASPAKFPGIA